MLAAAVRAGAAAGGVSVPVSGSAGSGAGSVIVGGKRPSAGDGGTAMATAVKLAVSVTVKQVFEDGSAVCCAKTVLIV